MPYLAKCEIGHVGTLGHFGAPKRDLLQGVDFEAFFGDSSATLGYFDEKKSWLTIFSQWFWKIPYLLIISLS